MGSEVLLGCKLPHLKQNSFSLQREAIFFLHHNLILIKKSIFIFTKQTQCNYTAKALSLQAKSNAITSKKQCFYKVLSMIY